MTFESYFTIVSLQPGLINIKPKRVLSSVNLTPLEARRMAEHLVKIATLMEAMDVELSRRVENARFTD
jgi:hypothetical protein